MEYEYDGEKGDMLCYIEGLEAKLNAAMDEVDRLNEDNEQLKAEIEWLQTRIKYQHEDLAKVTPENRLLREENEELKKIMRGTVTLQDAVNGAEKASKRIDGWPEWKQELAYRHHDTDEDEESE